MPLQCVVTIKRVVTISGCLLAISGCVRFGYDVAGTAERDGGGDLRPSDAYGSDGTSGLGDLTQGQERSLPSDGPLSHDSTVSPDLIRADSQSVFDGFREDISQDGFSSDQAVPGDLQPIPDTTSPSDGPALLTASFTLLSGAGGPSARRSSGAAFRPAGDTMWTFGGYNSSGWHNDLWVYHTNPGWAAAGQSNVPSARELHSLAWHGGEDRLVMFGGQQQGFPSYVFLNELQVYNPATQSWTKVDQNSPWPEGRRGATFVWVPHLGRFLLFGGVKGLLTQTRFNDLWQLNLTVDAISGSISAAWSLLSPTGVAAPAVNNACSGYDPAQRRLIVFGGEAASGDATRDVYQYLVDSNRWQHDTPGGTLPPDRSYAQCDWDPTIARLVVYGGQDDSGPPLDGCYLYDPVSQVWSWSPPPVPPGSYPGPISDGSAAYSAVLGGVVWFGGRKASTTYTNETWLVKVP